MAKESRDANRDFVDTMVDELSLNTGENGSPALTWFYTSPTVAHRVFVIDTLVFNMRLKPMRQIRS